MFPAESDAATPAPADGPPAAPPDWSAVTADVFCPLCNYNLRGLIEPRCPECGYRFEWAALLAANKQVHPFLFEHHPERNFWSFWRTWTAAWRPRRFWRSVQPVHTIRPNRLAAYWGIGWALFLAAPFLWTIAAHAAYCASAPLTAISVRIAYAWPQQLSIRSDAFLTECRDSLAQTRPNPLLILVQCAPAMWLVATVGSLLIFQVTLSRMGVRTVQLVRAAAYSIDPLLWLVLFGLAGAETGLRSSSSWSFDFPFFMVALGYLLFTYRMVTSCRDYLRFPRPIAVAITTQLIAALVTAKIFGPAIF